MTPTRDELLKLAKEAGLPISSENYDMPTGYDRFAALLSAHQAQAEPAAWQFKHPEDTGGAWKECSKDDFIYWATRPDWVTRALYAAPPSSDQTWNEAIKAVARHFGATHRELWTPTIMEEVRALARPSQAQEPSTPCQNAEHMGEHACQDRNQCWEPCGELGHSAEHARVAQPVSGAVDERQAFEVSVNGERVAFDGVDEWTYPATYKRMMPLVQGLAKMYRAALSRAQQAPAVSDELIDTVRKAMRAAFNLGQTYWQQADSEYTSHHKKADGTAQKFSQLTDETCTTLSQPAAAPVSEQTKAWLRLSDVQPEFGERVMVVGVDADDDHMHELAHYNGKKTGFLGVGGMRIKNVIYWLPLPKFPTKEQSQ